MKNKFTKKHKHVLITKGTQGMAKLSLAVVSGYFSSFINYLKSSAPCARMLSFFGGLFICLKRPSVCSTSCARALSGLWLSIYKGYRASSTSCARALSLLGIFVLIAGTMMFTVKTNQVTAATSNQLNFQGRLLTNTGTLVPDGIYNMQFDLYYVASGGVSQWTEDRLVTNTQGVTVQNGYYSVYLGEYDTIPALNWSEDIYLGMTIRGTTSCAWGSCTPADSEMTPRFKLTAVPYAFKAANVASSSTNSASTNSDGVSITTGNALGATSNSGALTISTGSGTTNSGNISIDAGNGTSSDGTITLGSANASALTLGRAGLTTTNAGALTVNQTLLVQGATLTVGTTSQAGSLVLYDGSSSTGTIQLASLGSNEIYTLPDSDGSDTFCLADLGNCFGSGSGSTLQAAYDAGNSITTTDNRNILFTLADTATDADFIIDLLGTGNIFEVRDASTPVLTVVDGGGVTLAGTGTALTLSGAATTAISVSNTGTTTDISLQNGETIDNDTNGTINISGNLRTSSSNHQIRIYDTDTSTEKWSLSTVSNVNFGIYEDVSTQRLLLAASTGDLTLNSGTGAISAGLYNGQTISSSANLTGTLTVAGNATFDTNTLVVDASTDKVRIGTASGFDTTLDVRRALTSATATEQEAILGSLTINIADTNTKAAIGASSYTTHTTGTLQNLMAYKGGVWVQGSGGTTTNAYGLWTRNDTSAGAIITNSIGVRVENSNGGGTVTNQYGLYVSNQTAGATADYGLYVAGADTYAIYVDAGATRLDGTLEVQGTSTVGLTGTTTGQIGFLGSTAASGVINLVGQTNPTGTRTITLPDESGTICTTGSVCTGYQASVTGGAANQQLSNLSGTIAINASLLPASDDAIDLGDNTHRWRDLYLGPATLHIGTSTSDEYKLTYDTTNNTLEVQAAVDAVEGFQVLDTDGGTPILNVDTTNERVGIGTAAPNATLQVGNGSPVGVTTFNGYNALIISEKNVPATDDDYVNLYSDLTLDSTVNSNEANNAGKFDINIKATNAYDFGNTNAITATAFSNGTGTVSLLRGGAFGASNTSTGTITALRGVEGWASNAGTVTDLYSIYVQDLVNTGTITNTYGLYVGDVTAGTQTNQAYGLYVSDSGARNYIGGTLEVTGAVNLGTTGVAGSLVVSDGSSSTVTIKSATQVAATNYDVSIPAITANDTFCLATAGNCSAIGAAGGALTGTFPSPTLAGVTGTGSVTFQSSTTGVLETDSSNFYFDNANNRLGVGTATVGNNILTVNNAATTDDIVEFQDNGVSVLTVADGGAITATGTITQTSNSATAFRLQDTTGTYNNLTFDSTTNHLKVYDVAGARTAFVDIYYDNATSSAVFAASTGTTQIGNGTGDVNISLTNNSEKFNFTHTGTDTPSSDTDFIVQRNLTGTSNSLDGNVLKVEDISTFTSGSSAPNLLYLNQNNSSATGNLILAQTGGAVTKFSVDTDGTLTSGDIMPLADDTYDLGDNTHRFRDLYLGGETIHLGTSTSDEATLGYTTSTNTFTLQSTGTIALNSITSLSYTDFSTPGLTQGLTVTSTGEAEISLDPGSTGNSWTLSANDDTSLFRIFQVTAGVATARLSVDSTIATFAGNLTVSGAAINIGSADTGSGDNGLNVYGGGTGTYEGGQIVLFTSADHDTTIDSYAIDAYTDDLRVHSAGTVKLTINQDGDATFNYDLTVSGGNLGIGTAANSSYILQAYYDSDTYARLNNDNSGDFYISGANADLYVQDSATSNFTRIHNNGVNGYIDTTGSTGGLILRPANSIVDVTGSVRASTTVQGDLLLYANTGTQTGTICRSGAFLGYFWIGNCSSLSKFKDEQQNLPYGLDTIRQLRPVQYRWNIDGNYMDTGFIAEEVQAVAPIFAEYTEGKLSGVKYDHMVSLAINGVKELDVQVQTNDTRLSVVEAGNFTGNIHVADDAQIDGNLAVIGDTTLFNLIVTGGTEVQQLTVNGKIISNGLAPVATIGQTLTAVLGASITNDGTDTAGTVTLNSGTQASLSGEVADVQFTSAYTTEPKIVISGNNAKSAKLGAYVVRTTSGFKIMTDTPLELNQDYSFDYFVIQTTN